MITFLLVIQLCALVRHNRVQGDFNSKWLYDGILLHLVNLRPAGAIGFCPSPTLVWMFYYTTEFPEKRSSDVIQFQYEPGTRLCFVKIRSVKRKIYMYPTYLPESTGFLPSLDPNKWRGIVILMKCQFNMVCRGYRGMSEHGVSRNKEDYSIKASMKPNFQWSPRWHHKYCLLPTVWMEVYWKQGRGDEKCTF